MIGSLKGRAATLGVAAALSIGLAVGVAAPASASNAANAKLCQKGGWQQLVRADQTPFTSETDCVSYGAHGGTPAPPTGGGGNSGSDGT